MAVSTSSYRDVCEVQSACLVSTAWLDVGEPPRRVLMAEFVFGGGMREIERPRMNEDGASL